MHADVSVQAKAAARGEMIRGLLWFGVAIAITLGTYLYAATRENGGHYFVFYGAMIYGVYRLLRGLYYWAKPEALVRKAQAE
jgi:hypothetical protein